MKGVDNWFLPADDLPASMAFYRMLGLSLKFDFSGMGMAAFRAGEGEPAIILKDRGKFPDAKPAVWFVVDDVRAEYDRLAKLGVRFLSEPFKIRTGTAAEFEDPSGNRLGITDYENAYGGK
jgi:predicted enzyme related to lactoylglutathione lyase